MGVLTHGSLFSGLGGIDLGFDRAGIETKWQVEINPFCREILTQHWPNVRRYEDVKTIRGREIEKVDIISGGFPCQDVSLCGLRKGLAGERSGLFYEFQRILKETYPQWVVIENVCGLLTSNHGRDFRTVTDALQEIGYGIEWRVLDAQFFGVPQRRRRVFIVGHLGADIPLRVLFRDASMVERRVSTKKDGAPCFRSLPLRAESVKHGNLPILVAECPNAPSCIDSQGVRTFDGVPRWVDIERYKALGNAVCPNVSQWIGEGIVKVSG